MAQSPSTETRTRRPLGIPTLLLGLAMVAVDVAVVYTLLATGGVPAIAAYGGTGLVAVVVGGSFLVVVGRRFLGSAPAPDAEASTLARGVRVVVSITVLTGVTAVLGYGGGLLLWLSSRLGGPDPVTEDGDLLRDRLLDWPDRNRAFMRTNGRDELPLQP